MVIDVEEFIMVKGFKAKGKRITTCNVTSIEELEPTKLPENPSADDNDEEDDNISEETPDETAISEDLSSQSQPSKNGQTSEQLSLFPDEDS